jgi:hypothetical protein
MTAALRIRSAHSRRSARAIAAMLLIAAFLPARAEEGWFTLAPPGEGFSVEMPGEGARSRDNNHDPELFERVEDYGADYDGGYFIVSAFHFRPEKREALTDAEIFEFSAALIGPTCQTVLVEPYLGGPGAAQAIRYDCGDGIRVAERVHLVGDRLYRLSAGGSDGVETSDGAARFFDSFRIVDE